MSMEFSQIKESLVDKILEQGQRLRNAMVQSILQNDPLNSDIIYNKTYNTPVSSAVTVTDLPVGNTKLLESYLNGDYLTKDQEEIALNTIRSMRLSDVCQTTEKTLFPKKCSCATCIAYQTNNLKCDLRRSPVLNHKEANHIYNAHVLKQVDSLKVILQSIHLNSLGNKKVTQGLNKKQFNSCLNETYFVEYYIPEVFTKEIPKSQSKTNSGLENNHVRVCARGTSNVIQIRQIFVHLVYNLYDCNLEDHDLILFVKYKNASQKKSELLGIAKFNLGVFKNLASASCGKTLPLYLNEESPITVGTIKVTLQLGAGKLYFGQEFLDAVSSRKNSLDTESSEETINVDSYKNKPSVEQRLPKKIVQKEEQLAKDKESSNKKSAKCHPEITHTGHFQQNKFQEIKASPVIDKERAVQTLVPNIKDDILFGFLYISEAQFHKISPSSFILCQPYCQNDTSASRVVYNSSNPLYNFCQTIPLLYEEDLLLNLRENFMLIEFWDKTKQTEELIGLTRLPLHQFYLGYRNSIILKHLKRNKLPIIGTDWWEPIYSADNTELIGQVQVLTALGTEDQIRNLEEERGFKKEVVKAKFLNTVQTKVAKQPSSYFTDKAIINKRPLKPVTKKLTSSVTLPYINAHIKIEPVITKPQTVDVGIQSNIDTKMDNADNMTKVPQAEDMLSSFLKLLEQIQRRPCVESSTNTEIADPKMCKTVSSEAPQLRKTSDLLDSLQKALSLDSNPEKKTDKPRSFRAQISIICANQLPSRRKIKSKAKRIKGKSPKQDGNILPSTYVTFETMPGEPLQITRLYPKSTSPKWDYTCEVSLPMDLLTNSQKRLIFKVWKKCTNAILQPNMQTDLVLGFAAVDLSVLSVGLPNVQGWFNIIDFSGKCNGQINIHVNPLEKIDKINGQNSKITDIINSNPSSSSQVTENDECNELLSRALKRKFTELDEITQRLRLRLSEVVSEDSEGSNDDITEEFEHDINNLCIEEDFDLINFEEQAKKFNMNYNSQKGVENDKPDKSHTVSQPGTSQPPKEISKNCVADQDVDSDKLDSGSSGLLMEKDGSGDLSESSSTSRSVPSDKQITEGKHRIDTLLEQLSLITKETIQPFSNRYVSGCSAVSNDANDVQDLLKDLEQHSRPNITAANSFDPVLFQQLYGGPMNKGSSQNSPLLQSASGSGSSGGGSETSVITNFSECRPNPDGQGTASDDKGI